MRKMFTSIPHYEFDFGKGLVGPIGSVTRHQRNLSGSLPDRALYRLLDLPLVRVLGRRLPSLLGDLLDIALAAYLADRLTPRAAMNDQRPVAERWSRSLKITVPVRDVERWSAPAIRDQLLQILTSLTDDAWDIQFVPRSADARSSELQSSLGQLRDAVDPMVVLFSGGLDSTLGLIDAVRRSDNRRVIAASVLSNHRLGAVEANILRELRGKTRRDVNVAQVIVGLRGVGWRDQETTQRARGFLYLAVGAIAALMSGSDELIVFENGVGAINLPFTADQIGALNSKAMHPRVLGLFQEFVSQVSESRFRITNPAVWHTKGELCRRILQPNVQSAAGHTVSCDRFPRERWQSACGRCTSCLLRRLSLHASSLVSLDKNRRYSFDPLDATTCWADYDIVPPSCHAASGRAAANGHLRNVAVGGVEDRISGIAGGGRCSGLVRSFVSGNQTIGGALVARLSPGVGFVRGRDPASRLGRAASRDEPASFRRGSRGIGGMRPHT